MKTLNRSLLLLLAASALTLPLLASSTAWSTEQFKLCLRASIAYADSAQGTASPDTQEDHWAWTSPNYVPLRGVYATVKEGGATLWGPEYVAAGDFSGSPGTACTGQITVPTANGNYSITIESIGSVQGETLTVQDRTTTTTVTNTSNFVILGGPGTYDATVSVSTNQDEWLVYAALAHATWFNPPSGNSDHSHLALAGAQPGGESPAGCSSGGCYRNDRLYFSSASSTQKFIITHELGHLIGDISTNGNATDFLNGCSPWDFNDGDDCDSAGSHSMVSKESAHCAFSEGFAHFYAATSWNLTSETDCYFEYWAQVLSGETGTPRADCETTGVDDPFDVLHMETSCASAWNQNGYSGTSWEGMGNELDWLRTFWDMRTGIGACTTKPTFSNILTWLRNAVWDSGWPADANELYTYEVLDDEANTTGGNLNTCWDASKGSNGIDHLYVP